MRCVRFRSKGEIDLSVAEGRRTHLSNGRQQALVSSKLRFAAGSSPCRLCSAGAAMGVGEAQVPRRNSGRS